jgi:hypothetical protein
MRTKIAILLCVMVGLLAANPVAAVNVYKASSAGLADVNVFVTDSAGQADCVIYEATSEGLAAGNAKWYYVDSAGLADVKIYFTSSAGQADKKVFFTKSQGLAKCDVDWKSYKKSTADWVLGSPAALRFSAGALLLDLSILIIDSGRGGKA